MKIILGIGGTDKRRRLANYKWFQLIELFNSYYPTFSITVIGNIKELNNFKCKNNDLYYNKFNAENLNELINKVSDSNLVITNETSLCHVAENYNKKCLVILGGGHFGRFVQINSKNLYSIYKVKDCFLCDWKCKFNISDTGEYQCINPIEAIEIFNNAQIILNEKNNILF
jgi:ADP-heptose:LPS heptosyltransferase